MTVGRGPVRETMAKTHEGRSQKAGGVETCMTKCWPVGREQTEEVKHEWSCGEHKKHRHRSKWAIEGEKGNQRKRDPNTGEPQGAIKIHTEDPREKRITEKGGKRAREKLVSRNREHSEKEKNGQKSRMGAKKNLKKELAKATLQGKKRNGERM